MTQGRTLAPTLITSISRSLLAHCPYFLSVLLSLCISNSLVLHLLWEAKSINPTSFPRLLLPCVTALLFATITTTSYTTRNSLVPSSHYSGCLNTALHQPGSWRCLALLQSHHSPQTHPRATQQPQHPPSLHSRHSQVTPSHVSPQTSNTSSPSSLS